MSFALTQLVAALVTTTLLGYAGAIALAGVQSLIAWRSPGRNAAVASLLQYAGTVLGLLGLVYRHQEVGTVGLLMVILSLLIADIRRASAAPGLEVGLTVLAIANLLAVTIVIVA
jgi:hypothetical protein